ncbi:MAG TPA: HAD family hydrolase [Chloroflexota bacterium]|nr:HAD family hydrolase [Chloroflexota bacterium]
MAALRAVIFDLGGTLMEWREGLTIEDVWSRVAPKAIELLSPEQTARVSAPALVAAVRRAYLDLEHAAGEGDQRPVPGELCVRQGLASLGVEIESEVAAAMLAALYVSERETTQLLPHAVEMLDTLHRRGLCLGVISNRMHGGALLLDDLAYFGISHYFDSLVASCDAGWMKPHPNLFIQALRDLGVEPGEAVMVGDDLRADIGGALAMGMGAVWIRQPAERTDPPPPGVPVIGDLAELPGILSAR